MDKRDVHYFPVCSFCKLPHDRLEPCPVADKAIEELVLHCPSCAALRARIEEMEDERDRWYGAAHERMIKINGLESTCRVQGQVIADQRARIEVLEQAIEWAIQYLERDVFNVDEVNALIEWMIDELRRRAKEG